nr:MAG TPA: hypothetical protein [Inoviridae sp.]
MLPQYEGVVKRKFQKGGRITHTPTGSRRHGSHYVSRALTSLFWKGISKRWAYYTHAHRLAPSRQSLRIESPYQPVLEGQGLRPCGGRGTRWRRYRVTKRGDCLHFFFSAVIAATKRRNLLLTNNLLCIVF